MVEQLGKPADHSNISIFQGETPLGIFLINFIIIMMHP
jgi:hypothetical protein